MATQADPLDGYVTRRSAGRLGAIRRKGKYRRRFLRRNVRMALHLVALDPQIVG